MAITLVGIMLIVGSVSCARGGFSGKVESITIGSAPLESSALVYVAEDQRFFADNGLNVTIRDYDTGAAAFNGLLDREVDIAVPAEYPLIGAAFKGQEVQAIASIDKVQYFFLFGRKDRGIETTADLKGKRIGVVQKTIAEFYMGRFLALQGVDIGEVKPVNVSLSQSEDAITNSDVDAIVARPPYAIAIEKRLGANGVVWPAQSSQALYALLIGQNNWIREHPEPIKRLLRSLAQAEEYIIKNPAQAKAIVQKRLNFDDAYMATIWSQNQFSLTMDQSLVVAMEDEARWMIGNNLTDAKDVPNFLGYVFEDALNAISPGAVNIIR